MAYDEIKAIEAKLREVESIRDQYSVRLHKAQIVVNYWMRELKEVKGESKITKGKDGGDNG